MNRPVYETSENITAEDSVAESIAKSWDIKLVKLKKLYPFDRAFIFEEEITGLLEIKCRNYASTDFPTYLFSAEKVRWAHQFMKSFDVSCYLAVKWTDRIGWHKIRPTGYALRLGGRKDRADDQDIEPCVFIPMSQFDKLTK